MKHPANSFRSRAIIAAIAMLAPLALDQLTKVLAIRFLKQAPPISIIPGFLQFSYAENTGAAWGMLQDKTLWLAWLSVAAMIVTLMLIVQALHHGTLLEIVAFSVLTGGIVGNAIDRIARGAVVDFIDMYFRDWHWPTYNVADSAITIGVALIIWHAITTEASQRESE